MNLALATSHDRMAPCFAGVELWILDENAELNQALRLSTHGWHPLAWGRELMRRDVGLLVCAGVNLQTWAGIQGHGIDVIPDAIGDPGTVLEAWRNRQLQPPPTWPACGGAPRRAGRRGGRQHRFRGGR